MECYEWKVRNPRYDCLVITGAGSNYVHKKFISEFLCTCCADVQSIFECSSLFFVCLSISFYLGGI